MAPRGAKFPRKFGPGGPNFGGAKFPGTPASSGSRATALRREELQRFETSKFSMYLPEKYKQNVRFLYFSGSFISLKLRLYCLFDFKTYNKHIMISMHAGLCSDQ